MLFVILWRSHKTESVTNKRTTVIYVIIRNFSNSRLFYIVHLKRTKKDWTKMGKSRLRQSNVTFKLETMRMRKMEWWKSAKKMKKILWKMCFLEISIFNNFLSPCAIKLLFFSFSVINFLLKMCKRWNH